MNQSTLAMIRYYSQKFNWIFDYCVGMAIDIGYVYGRLREIGEQIIGWYENKSQNMKKMNKQEKIVFKNVQILFKEIQKVNQEVYIMFNNYYNKRNLAKYQPKLINIQKYTHSHTNIKTNNNKLLIRKNIFPQKQNILEKTLTLVRQLTQQDQTTQIPLKRRSISCNYSQYSLQNMKEMPIDQQLQKQLQQQDSQQIYLDDLPQKHIPKMKQIESNTTLAQSVQQNDKIPQIHTKRGIKKQDIQILIQMSQIVYTIRTKNI